MVKQIFFVHTSCAMSPMTERKKKDKIKNISE